MCCPLLVCLAWAICMLKKYLLISFIFFPFLISAQKATFTVSGFVQDVQTSERLVGATVWHPKHKIGVITNKQGYFSISLPHDSTFLVTSFVGYEPQKLRFLGVRDTVVTVHLKPLLPNTEVEISAERRADQSAQIGTIELPVSQIKQAPVLMGESDVLKVMQLMPGIKSGMEGNSNFYVRGGSADQNLILLDDVPIYNPFHALGFISVFNPNTLKNVAVYKGGFPARYGGRLSSILDITMKEGNLNKHQGEANVGVMSANIALEGPLLKNKVSYLVGGRISYLNLWLNSFSEQSPSDPHTSYNFYDLNAKISADLSTKDRVQLSFYKGKDGYELDEKEFSGTVASAGDVRFEQVSGLDWQNRMVSLKWGRIWNKFLFSSTKLYEVGYELAASASVLEKLGAEQTYTAFKFSSGIQDRGLKTDWEYSFSNKHQIQFGASWIEHQFSPGASRLHLEKNLNASIDTVLTPNRLMLRNHEYAIYVEDEFKSSDAFQVIGGVHASMLNTNGASFLSIQPRVSASYIFSNFTLKAGFSTMQQPLHLVVSSGLGLPTDLWIPATKRIVPQFSKQWSLAIAKSLPKYHTELSLETYYKTMDHVTEYKPDAVVIFEFEKHWEDQILQGKGKSYGIEALAHKKQGRLNGWIGYTWAHTLRQFDEINQGEVFPFKYDRRHDVSLVINYRVSSKLHSGLVWVYGTGNAITLPQAALKGFGFDGINTNFNLLDMGKVNGYRLDAYHRLDFNVKYEISPQQDKSGIVLGVYNAYNRKNPVYAYLSTRNGYFEFRQVALFPVVPYISVDLKF
jgi:hypothetical protein